VEVRKILSFVETVFSEAGQTADHPLRKVAIAAVVKNPYAGGYSSDLSRLIDESGELGTRIATLAVEALGDDAPQSYGKGAVVGTAGEQEHGVACLTTVYGNAMRESVGGGKAWVSSLTKRAAPGVQIDIPLAHKDALFVRSHYDGMTITLHDAPLEDEIVVICCVSNGPRLNERVGGPSADSIIGEDGLR
jgi:hypothetical protein